MYVIQSMMCKHHYQTVGMSNLSYLIFTIITLTVIFLLWSPDCLSLSGNIHVVTNSR